jgi:hypothetical protein
MSHRHHESYALPAGSSTRQAKNLTRMVGRY